MARDTGSVIVVVPESSAYLSVLREAVASAAESMGCDGTTNLQLQMALDEACTNIVEHGVTMRGRIRLKVETMPGKLVMHIQDMCERFSPLDHPAPSLEEYFDSSRTKGLGLFILRQFVDEVKHSYRSRTGNKLKLTKYLGRLDDPRPSS
jgi:serine/threonine-protein kinase RsbW